MTHEGINTEELSENFASSDWEAMPARLSNLENKVDSLPCELGKLDLTKFITHDNFNKRAKTFITKNDFEVEIGKVTDSMVTPKDLEKLATLEELEKLSVKVAELSKAVSKCAKQEDLDKLATEVSRLSKEVEKCAKQEDLDKLSYEVTKLSDEVTNLSEKFTLFEKQSKKFAKKKHLKRLEALIMRVDAQSESRAKTTNMYIAIATGFLALVVTAVAFMSMITENW